MRPRSCSLCGHPADVSVLIYLSTLRVRKRRQQSAKAIPLCNACVNTARESDGHEVGRCLMDALTQARSALTRQSDEQSHSATTTSSTSSGQSVGPESTNTVDAE